MNLASTRRRSVVWIMRTLFVVASVTSLAVGADQPQSARRVLYNFDGDSCLSTKAGSKGYLFNFFTSREGGENANEPRFEVLCDLGLLSVGLRKQLFVDDFVVAAKQQVTRELGQVTKANDGKPIFTDGWFYGTVLHDEGKFKLWFRKPGTSGFGYAESADGLNFTKQADLSGINFAGDYTLAVEIDSAESDPQHRFKAGYDAPGMAAGIAHSADGITWTPYHDGQPVTKRAADTYNQILWDPEANTYRLFTRTDFGTAGGSTELRGTRSMTNPAPKTNPANWSLVREWVFDKEGKGEAQRRQIYATTCWIYHGVYFALLSVYDFPGDVSEGKVTDTQTRHERDVMNFYVATSRDGDSWDLHWVYAGQPLVPRGPDGAFDKDIVLPASTIVTHADKHWLYYAGANERHGNEQVKFDRKHAIGLATLRLDGFVSLSAGEVAGTVVTKPFKLEGDKLIINVDARGGEVSVEVLDETGQPWPGFSGDEAVTATKLDRWKTHADLSAVRGKIVRLKFHLRDAKLYSFQMVSGPIPHAPAAAQSALNVFILAGQSNMAGADSEVAEPLGFQQTEADRATRFTMAPLPDGEKSRRYLPWGEIRGHQSKNRLVHGPEVGFARTLYTAGWRDVAIIKVHANFGRDVQSWPWGERGALFDAWTKFVDARLAELKAQGHTTRVCGFLWHQGIDDAIHGKLASHYERNLNDLIGALRTRYAAEQTPFVLARSVSSRIAQPNPDPGNSSSMAMVRRAQVKVGESVSSAAWIDVDDLPNVNTHHFSADSQLVIGRRFGEAFSELLPGDSSCDERMNK